MTSGRWANYVSVDSNILGGLKSGAQAVVTFIQNLFG
jgi:hypothetical protein